LRLAVGAPERDPYFDPADTRQTAVFVIFAAGFSALGAAVVPRLSNCNWTDGGQICVYRKR
jgi:hypothetical protein